MSLATALRLIATMVALACSVATAAAKETEGRQIKQVESRAFRFGPMAIGQAKDLDFARAEGLGVVPASQLDDYLAGVLARLLEGSPVTGVPARVYVRASNQWSAKSTADANIFVASADAGYNALNPADVSAGNTVALLRNGKAAFDAMCGGIAAAREQVDMEQYIYRGDSVGMRVRDALVSAAERGVRVRLLLDWVGRMGTPMKFFAPIRQAGGDVRIFQKPGFRSWLGLIPRDHRKLLVVDRASGITGGIGIGEQWRQGLLRKRSSPWRDTAVQITGPAAVDMAESFERMWERAGGRRLMMFRRFRVPRATHRPIP